MAYDPFDQDGFEPEEAALVTSYGYDSNDSTVSQTLPGSATVELEYDALNRNTRRERSGFPPTYDYDSERNSVSVTDHRRPDDELFLRQAEPPDRDDVSRRPERHGGRPSTSGRNTTATNNVVRIVETKTGGVVDKTENVYGDFDRRKRASLRGVAVEYDYDDNGNRDHR